MEFLIGKKEHLEGILNLYKQLHPDENPIRLDKAEEIWNLAINDNIKYFIAIENKKVIASVFIVIIPNLTHEGRPIGIIENLIIDKNYRSKGIGKEIVKMAVEYGKKQNCHRIALQSNNDRIDAHKFYKKIRFNPNLKTSFELDLKK